MVRVQLTLWDWNHEPQIGLFFNFIFFKSSNAFILLLIFSIIDPALHWKILWQEGQFSIGDEPEYKFSFSHLVLFMNRERNDKRNAKRN